MAGTQFATKSDSGLEALAVRLDDHPGFSAVVQSLKQGDAATLDGVWGSSRALVAANLLRHAPGPLVVVCPRLDDVDHFSDDLSLFTEVSTEQFPAWETEPGDQLWQDEIYGDRLRLLKSLLAGSSPEVLVTSIQSLIQGAPDPDFVRQQTRTISVGQTIDPDELLAWLVERGFHHTSAVELPGEFAMRGGILDIFAPDWFEPVRIELFDTDVESIRKFETATQRSLAEVRSIDITLIAPGAGERVHLADYLPKNSWLLLIDPHELETEGRNYLRRLENAPRYHTVSEVLRQAYRFPSVTSSEVAAGSMETTCHLQMESVERFSGDISKVRDELDAAGRGQRMYVVCETASEAERLSELFAETQAAAESRLHFPIGRLSAGFRLVREKAVLVSGMELFHRAELARPARRRLGRAIDSFLDLREGDLVVHLSHGVGRYRGLKLLEKEEQVEEHLELEFAAGTKIYVPSSKIDLVQKYVGGSKSKPRLAKVGGKSWLRQKKAAEQAVTDLAADMLELQARRAARPGIRFPDDTTWQLEFEGSFPYQETPDQLSALSAIKNDMTEPRPMDRLLCGDVGYGKTELAIRSAFKAVDSGYQVGVLVPTTILCEQHYQTFSSRMAEFPFEIASLSRFSTRAQQRQVLEGLANGSVDIVVGTHRLAQHDVRFHNLGLVIIDEEQRFGVEIKERLKSLRTTVDVLTMTATPIPRTLHMSLLGVRDISNLETPPEERMAVETRVSRFDPEMIRHAVLRELSRGGQIFFVHNRVHDIHALRHRIQEIVPEATIEVGHGQMPEAELEDVMTRFVAGDFDMLLATTIVESGLDIPNANTIFIDDADRYGLADLHQLRGRVGRYKHRAYCYLLLDPKRHLSPEAARRMRAIEEFSEMGAGFAIAMRDLELRGAGNLLGAQQSGHITAVGYELYCSLLEKAVRQMQALPPKEVVDVDVDLPVRAFLPDHYVSDMRLKIDLYRRLARLTSMEAVAELRAELEDRFGPVPVSAEGLLALAELRIAAHRREIRSIHIEGKYLVFKTANAAALGSWGKKGGLDLRVVDSETVYLPAGNQLEQSEQSFEWLKSLLSAS